MGSGPEEERASVVWWYSSGYLCIFARRQQGEQAVVWWVLSLCTLSGTSLCASDAFGRFVIKTNSPSL